MNPEKSAEKGLQRRTIFSAEAGGGDGETVIIVWQNKSAIVWSAAGVPRVHRRKGKQVQ